MKVHGDCHIQFEQCRYSAPHTLVHQSLWLRASDTSVRIYQAHELKAIHSRLKHPGDRSTLDDHLPPNAACLRALIFDNIGYRAIKQILEKGLDLQDLGEDSFDTLAARNREAIEHQLSHPEFLALLIQDEVARREQKKYAMRFRRAGFRHNKTLESFDLDFNPNFNQSLLKELASGGFIEEKVAVLIAGSCGTGKSHLAQALWHCAVQKGYDVLCHSQAKLLSYLHAARATIVTSNLDFGEWGDACPSCNS